MELRVGIYTHLVNTDEVRKLAERTAISTQEISGTIDTVRSSASNALASM